MKPIQKPRKFIQGVNKDITISVALIYDIQRISRLFTIQVFAQRDFYKQGQEYSEYKKQCQKLMSDKDTKTFESY